MSLIYVNMEGQMSLVIDVMVLKIFLLSTSCLFLCDCTVRLAGNWWAFDIFIQVAFMVISAL